jgi:glycosyltransferase involved in cell wall biosynthesis
MSGGARVLAIYARLLTEKGHEVCIISPPRRKVPLRRKIKSFLKGTGWLSGPLKVSHLDDPGLNHLVLDCYRPPTNDDIPDADVVIATWWETAEWVIALSDTKGAKVYFIQGHEIYNHLPFARCKATYHLPLHKVVISRWLKRIMTTEYGDTIVDLVPNSVDHSLFFANPRGKQRDPTLGFLYSPANFKGVDITLKAIRLLQKRLPTLRVIAFGAYKPKFEAGFESCIEFHCLPEQERIRELYAKCDVWVTASRSEGFNLPAMEAMACRTPVVATKTGWPEEAIMNGENGFLINFDDEVALAECVASVFSLPDKEWRAMSKNAYETVEKSSWEASANLFVKSLYHACKRAKKGEISGACACSL